MSPPPFRSWNSQPPRAARPRRERDLLVRLPQKIATLAWLLLIALLCISARLCQLALVEADQRRQEGLRPQRRELLEPAGRGTIRDRFNEPLAINKVRYQAAVVYSELQQQVAAFAREVNSEGKLVRVPLRKQYIRQLSEKLAKELSGDADRIEDLIHSKAALYQQLPFIVAHDIDERQYYRLKAMEREWPGLQAMRQPMRHYPRGKLACDLIGHLGAIDRSSYDQLIEEIARLKEGLHQYEAGEAELPPFPFATVEEAYEQLYDLTERAYTINDQVGKSGVEGAFESLLRGYFGKRLYACNAKGELLRQLPGGRAPVAGQRLLLTLSAELQQFCEELLIAQEERQARVSQVGALEKSIVSPKQPWIKGGAIVALDPHTGELLALASHPRFDPNDFVTSGDPKRQKEKASHIARWFETDLHLAQLWEGSASLEREVYDQAKRQVAIVEKPVTWSYYLDTVLPPTGALKEAATQKLATLGDAIALQKTIEELTELVGSGYPLYPLFNELYPAEEGAIPYGNRLPLRQHEELLTSLERHSLQVMTLKNRLDYYLGSIPSNFEKVLLLDLAQMAVSPARFSPELLDWCQEISLEAWHRWNNDLLLLRSLCQERCEALFGQQSFRSWRQLHGVDFLKEKRQEEKEQKRYARPYIDLFDSKRKELFSLFWQEHSPQLLAAFLLGKWGACDEEDELLSYLEEMRRWREQLLNGIEGNRPAFWPIYDRVQEQLLPLPPSLACDYMSCCRSWKELNRPLYGRYRSLRTASSDRGGISEQSLAAAFYPRYGYGYGRSYGYRQATTLGSLFKLVTSYTALLQRYLQLQEQGLSPPFTEAQLNPLTFCDQVFRRGNTIYVGIDEAGQPIPQYYRGGRIPKTLARSLGTIDLTQALVSSSNSYFALLAGNLFESGQQLLEAAAAFGFGSKSGLALPGEIGGHLPNDLSIDKTALYSTVIGQHTLVVTPLQAALMLATIANGGELLQPQLVSLTLGKRPLRGAGGQGADPQNQQRALQAIGLELPLFAASEERASIPTLHRASKEVRAQLPMPTEVKRILLGALDQVATKNWNGAISASQQLFGTTLPMNKYIAKGELIGKSSTAEATERLDLSQEASNLLYNHPWFGGILFSHAEQNGAVYLDRWDHPELVVVVYLLYGSYGKEALPLAAQVAAKWRQIQQERGSGS